MVEEEGCKNCEFYLRIAETYRLFCEAKYFHPDPNDEHCKICNRNPENKDKPELKDEYYSKFEMRDITDDRAC